MAWTISNAMMKAYESSLSSQELAAESSEAIFLAGVQCALSNTTPMPDQFYWPDKTTEYSCLSRFGMTCEPLMEDLGEALLTWYREGFPARTYQSQGGAQELMENVADYGLNKNASFAKWNQSTHLWKIAQRSLFEDLELSLQTWPRWGSMYDGECFHAPMQAEFIYEKESGYLLPTPCASDTSARKLPPNVHICKSGLPKNLNSKGQLSQMMLSLSLRLPTLGANEGKGSGKKRFIGSPDFHGAKMSEGLRTCESDPTYLNPSFAELVMMWPLGWTDLKPLGMDKFQDWYLSHSGF